MKSLTKKSKRHRKVETVRDEEIEARDKKWEIALNFGVAEAMYEDGIRTTAEEIKQEYERLAAAASSSSHQ